MKYLNVELTGCTPLLVHRFDDQAEQAKPVRSVIANGKDPREEATKHAYIADDGTYYISAIAIPRAMAAAGANFKRVGTRQTLRFVVPSAVRVIDDAATILDGHGVPATTFEVDGRPVTIPATKGRIMRYRPRWNAWTIRLTIGLQDQLLSVEDAQKLLVVAGETIGIGDYRPEKSGPFGTFRVTRFEEVPA